MTAVSSRTIATIPRPHLGEEIRVSIFQRGSARYIDVRIFTATRSSKGEPRPTRSGVCVRSELVDDLIAALEAAR